MAGTTLPPTWVVAYDAWGFRTLPCEYTPYVLAVRRRTADGETLDEEGAVEVTVEFDENGIACVEDVEVRTTHGMVVDPWRNVWAVAFQPAISTPHVTISRAMTFDELDGGRWACECRGLSHK